MVIVKELIDRTDQVIRLVATGSPQESAEKLPLCFGPCIQKYYENKINKYLFECLFDYPEISFETYVKSKVKKPNRNLKFIES